MNRLLDKYTKDQKIVITDTNYLELMEIIYNYPSEFIGKKIQLKVLCTIQQLPTSKIFSYLDLVSFTVLLILGCLA